MSTSLPPWHLDRCSHLTFCQLRFTQSPFHYFCSRRSLALSFLSSISAFIEIFSLSMLKTFKRAPPTFSRGEVVVGSHDLRSQTSFLRSLGGRKDQGPEWVDQARWTKGKAASWSQQTTDYNEHANCECFARSRERRRCPKHAPFDFTDTKINEGSGVRYSLDRPLWFWVKYPYCWHMCLRDLFQDHYHCFFDNGDVRTSRRDDVLQLR